MLLAWAVGDHPHVVTNFAYALNGKMTRECCILSCRDCIIFLHGIAYSELHLSYKTFGFNMRRDTCILCTNPLHFMVSEKLTHWSIDLITLPTSVTGLILVQASSATNSYNRHTAGFKSGLG